MSRKKRKRKYGKVSKEEVRESLLDGKWHRKADLARKHKVCTATMSTRIFDLVKDGVSIIIGAGGYRLVEPEDVTDTEAARAVEMMARYMIGTVTRQAWHGAPVKRLMREARKLLPKTNAERLIVRKYLVQLTHLIDWQDTEDE